MNRASTYWSEPEHGALVEELHEPAVQVLDAAANDDLVGVDVHPSVARQMLGGRMAHEGCPVEGDRPQQVGVVQREHLARELCHRRRGVEGGLHLVRGEVHKVDVLVGSQCGNALPAVMRLRPHAEVLVNSAGGEKGTGTKLVDFERSDWDFTMNLDLTSIFTMCSKVGGYTAV